MVVKKRVLAPAKVNLCLHVLGRRPDGYHELGMLMQRVSLYDRLDIVLTDEPGVSVSCEGVALSDGEENIAARAARRLLELSTSSCGVEIELEKCIPVAAGLGGGSSDAAAVLVELNNMLDLGMSRQELMAEGVKLGADVPFFVFGQTAWATGIGEKLEPIEGLPPVWYVLVNPGVAVSTAWVYQNLGLTSIRDQIRLPRFFRTPDELVGLLHNDLERVTIERYPQVAEAKKRLSDLGALGVLMSGSGSTVFGVFSAESEARRAAGALSGESGWLTYVVHPL